MNIANYIWGYKPVIGSNDAYNKATSEKVTVEGKEHATFSVTYNDKKETLDAETALSLVLQYVFYRCLDDNSISYDQYPLKLDVVRQQKQFTVIAIPPYYSLSNVRGIEVALEMSELGPVAFIPETVAVALDYGYFKASPARIPRRRLRGSVLRHGQLLHDPVARPFHERACV